MKASIAASMRLIVARSRGSALIATVFVALMGFGIRMVFELPEWLMLSMASDWRPAVTI